MTDEEEEEAMRRMHRMPAQGQLRRLCAVSQRQVAPDLQATPV
jgi:hypothetical protein